MYQRTYYPIYVVGEQETASIVEEGVQGRCRFVGVGTMCQQTGGVSNPIVVMQMTSCPRQVRRVVLELLYRK